MAFVEYADRARRDQQIRALKREDPERSCRTIARMVGCSHQTVGEVLNPKSKAANNRRRRQHMRKLEPRERYTALRRARTREKRADEVAAIIDVFRVLRSTAFSGNQLAQNLKRVLVHEEAILRGEAKRLRRAVGPEG